MKKALVILLVLAAIAGAGYVIYRTRQKKDTANGVPGGKGTPTETKPSDTVADSLRK